MNYKKTLFFVAKCLTISLEEKKKLEIENILKKELIDWDAVVKVSTAHYVFPALYCNLKRCNFLQYLPKDLVEYMEHITTLNFNRNTQIIAQATAINELLLANHITPIFLKGTGNLLEGLYEDIAERMVGDIDIIIKKEHVQSANDILLKNGYTASSYLLSDHRHLPRLTHKNKIAAVEIHHSFLEKPYSKNFNFQDISFHLSNKVHVLDTIDKSTLIILSNQVTDIGYQRRTVLLRNLYDFYLLNDKIEINEIVKKYNSFKKIIISYNSIFSFLFDLKTNPHTKFTQERIRKFLWVFENPKKAKIYLIFVNNFEYLKTRFLIFINAFRKKSNLIFIFSRFTNLDWFKRRVLKIKP